MPSERKPTGKPSKRALAARRNGARGGRPRERPGPAGIAWGTVRKYARLGADRDTIVTALGLAPEVLRDPAVVARMQDELARGEALHRIDLLVNVAKLRSGHLKDAKVSATLASLKHAMGWGKPDSGKGRNDQRPDQDAAVAEIQRMLGRFRGGPR